MVAVALPNNHNHQDSDWLSSSNSNSNHVDELESISGGPRSGRDARDSEMASSSYGNGTAGVTSMAYLPQTIVLCELRHESIEASAPSGPSESGLVSKWRPKDRMKTGCVALVLCLNISVDPPDVIKISPCARMECWIVSRSDGEKRKEAKLSDPFSMAPQKALETIGKNLNTQYERWQPRARYKLSLDPTVEEVRKLCTTCRKYAKSERVLFHYNGHGVPKPTANGEIWLFNKSYTQYIPLPVSDLDSWLKTPSIYVFDCSAAGMVVNAFIELQDWTSTSSSGPSVRDCILLAACEAHETLPQSEEFPADVFTSCLTTPIKMALRWFCTRSLLQESFDYSLIDKIPGRQTDRKTLLGELNWIFTAVTDTIAWNVLPHDLFQRLFRQDLLVASLFRNFLLAERIMRSANCSPISYPMLPPTHQHHMWDAWDMASEICLSQLPTLVEDPNAEFQPSPFFTEQLTAFELWLDHGSEFKKPPEQLPIVLQVLLSQCHRFRALVLLGRYLDMGPRAVDLALSVGIFPYVLKLLQTTTPELRQILVFIWTKILALDKSCQVDLVKDGGHTYFIRFLDSIEAYPEQRAMAAFVLAVIVDGHRRGQEACMEAGLLLVCLKHLQASTPNDAQAEPLFLQWLCLCLGKLWEDFTEAQIIALQADAPAIYAPLISEPQPEVRASAVFALGTLLDVGFHLSSDSVGEEESDDDEKVKGEVSIVKSLLNVVSDGSPLVRAEVAVALARFAFVHKKHLKAIAAAYWKPQSNSVLSSMPSFALRGTGSGYTTPTQYSQIGPLLRVGGDNQSASRDGRVSTSSPLATSGVMHGSPLSDDSSQHSDSGILNDSISNVVVNHTRPRPLDNALYSQCVSAMCTLAKDPSPRIAGLGRRVLSIIGIEQVVTNSVRHTGGSVRSGESTSSPTSSLAGLARSSSWFDMNAGSVMLPVILSCMLIKEKSFRAVLPGHLPLTFRTPPVSPPRPSYLTGMRRVCSLELRPHLMISPDSGLADPLLGSGGVSGVSERSLLPQSTIYNWSCGHFSKPLLTVADDSEEMIARREEREKFALDHITKCQHSSVSKLHDQIASWDTKFETGTKAALLHPFSPVVIAADESERIRVWDYEEATLLNSFSNHDYPDRGISKLCLLNELDDSLLLVASSDGSIRIWKDYSSKGKQRLVTAFSSVQGHRPGARSVNAVVDWQQQSGYMYASGEISSTLVWDLDKEQLSASQIHGGQFAAGFVDGSVRLFDIRTPEMLVCVARPHTQRVERVVGIGFQAGLEPAKVVSASQAGDIKFLDIRRQNDAFITINAHRGSLTALAVHRHAPLIASGSAKQLIKVFNLEGDQLSTIKYKPNFMAQKIGSVDIAMLLDKKVLLRRDVRVSETASSRYGDVTSMAFLPRTTVLCDLRHQAFEASGPSESGLVSKWRPKDRTKTGCVALVLCLNISVDPPDVIKISPCARMECWIDPFSMAPRKALEAIGKNLNRQYERWLARKCDQARYKLSLDPTVEEVRKLCTTHRKYAKSERVLFHYNGHGVPKPTANGEIWLFNKSYTQYIPLPVSDLDSWLKTPSMYVFDCSAAGMVVNAFMELQDWTSSSSSGPSARDCILLAACEAHETLPQGEEYPADIFTSCLTTPIKMALRWFCTRSLLHESLDYSLIDKIPGRQTDRKTLLGELNWIFSAVTDSIAWSVLPHDLFQRLFRQDPLVTSLFRNFLLAERIMRSANCSPVSYPMLPPTHQHHMWEAWDMAAEICLSMLPTLVEDPNTEFQPSPFFTEQLTAFEVWLDHGSEHKKPPEQLPIVLQVLLSQCHRFRALVLLGRFLDMGPWAVDLALSVGIFPYVLKLLQTTSPELRQILVFIWTKILARDKSCQVDLVKDGGHTYFIRFLDSAEAYPEQRVMAAFVLAVIVDGHRRGQEVCTEAGLLLVCLNHLQGSTPNDAQAEPLFLQWLCLCLGKLWEDFTEAQVIGLQADAPAIYASLLSEPQPEVRASAVFALGTLLDVGLDSSSDSFGEEECDYDEKVKAEISIVKSLLDVVSDGSPLVRAEVAAALARFAFGHKKHLKSVAAAYWKQQSKSVLNSIPSFTVRGTGSSYTTPTQYSQIGPLFRVSGDNHSASRDGRVSTSSPLATSGVMHGSLLSDDSSQHSDSGILNDCIGNGVVKHTRPRSLDNALYSQCVSAMCTLAKDPLPHIACLGRRVLSVVGIEQVVKNSARPTGSSGQPGESTSSPASSLAGLARSSSWFDMYTGHLPLTFRTPPVSPPRPSYLTGLRRVCSLEFRPHLLTSPDSGLADPLLGSSEVSGVSECGLLPQSTIYYWSVGHFSKPLLTVADDSEEMIARREEREKFALDHITKCQHSSVSKLHDQIASWDTKFETGTKTALLHPFSPVVIAADEGERIRVWNYEEATLLNSFSNHDYPDRGISKLCLMNELDDSLLLVASSDGSIRIWKDYSSKGKQRLVTAFSSVQGHRSGVRSVNAVVDWQQQSGYMYASGEISSTLVWDLEKEQVASSVPLASDCSISALSASQIHGGQFVAGFVDGSVRLFDIRTPEMLVCVARPHTQQVERVVGIGFQAGLEPAKIVSASQAGDIKFLDIRQHKDALLTIDANRGSLTALAVHRHAPLIASGSAKQLIEVFNLEGEQLGTIRYKPNFMAHKIGSVSCLTFHPYRAVLAAGAAAGCVSIYADEIAPPR
ncbi:hypothetical protein RJ640_010314 [Escallonia rubra]|uniref:Raptor N-terminal CASPase-like domain-containing protein n=1 Tax=Escallonia rubra TaxID=112253 RepID=A0AA88UNH4_9ASTE|nr:hypothetical protein RJ640_010314 [Escallonia rubra]